MLEHDTQFPQEDLQIPVDENQQTDSEPPALPDALSEQPESTLVSSETLVGGEPEQQPAIFPNSETDSAAAVFSLDLQAPPSGGASALAEQLSAPGDASIPTDLASSSAVQPIQPARRARLDRTAKLALCLALILLLLGGGGLFYDLAYYRPAQASLAATATVNGQATGTTSAYLGEIASTNATSTAQAQATAQTYQNIYQQATSGAPILDDSLNRQSSAGWDELSDPGQDFCGFKKGSYHVEQLQRGYFLPCFEENKAFGDFAYQVDMAIISGEYGGIIFRAHAGFFYFFEINLDGSYAIYLYNYNHSTQGHLITSGSTNYMEITPGATNTIALIARKNTFYFYLNQQFIESMTDNSYRVGLVGMVAESVQDPTDVAFNNAKVWQLS